MNAVIYSPCFSRQRLVLTKGNSYQRWDSKERGPPLQPLPAPVWHRSLAVGCWLGFATGAGAQKLQWFWPLKLPSKEGRHCVLQQSVGARSPEGVRNSLERSTEIGQSRSGAQGRSGVGDRTGAGWNRLACLCHRAVVYIRTCWGKVGKKLQRKTSWMCDLNEPMLNFQFYEEPFRRREKIHGREGMQGSRKAVQTTHNRYR